MGMFNYKNFIAACAIALAPVGAMAATITGQIDITGALNWGASTMADDGQAIFDGSGTADNAFVALPQPTGSFSTLSSGDPATVYDIDFDLGSDQVVWEAGGFTFTATSFYGFEDTSGTKAFSASGWLTGNDYDPTEGFMRLSAQDVNGSGGIISFSSTTVPVPLPAGGLLLLTALGGMAVVRRRRKDA
ncbi:VPLPA-CTERM sorting domain-containing protein [Aestuariivita boseongensis]|uniref:VPLPA-CTERM sorting domain-containing protein n=1 Tax=Aestuariivita boseongensis TaxID=1470562 RepID=UPI000680CF5F|nr:VPLPA-CTERM sorting domain-containing protein [Aestuariivita boseongensis]